MADEKIEIIEEKEVTKRSRKLTKSYEGNTVIFTEKDTGVTLRFDVATYPPAIQEHLPVFGLGSRLGDAAAGKHGQEAVDAINKCHEAMMTGNWVSRQPKGEVVSVKSVLANVATMSTKEQALAKSILEKLGIKIG